MCSSNRLYIWKLFDCCILHNIFIDFLITYSVSIFFVTEWKLHLLKNYSVNCLEVIQSNIQISQCAIACLIQKNLLKEASFCICSRKMHKDEEDFSSQANRKIEKIIKGIYYLVSSYGFLLTRLTTKVTRKFQVSSCMLFWWIERLGEQQ